MKRPRALAAAPLFLFLALFASACVGTESPQGWAAPVFDGDTVYFLASKDRLAAAPLTPEAQNATIAWNFPDKNNVADKNVKLQAVYGTPVIDGDRLYFTSFSGGVWALNKADGRPVWNMKTEIDGNVVSGIAVSGDLAAFGTTTGHLYVVNKSDKSPATGWPAGGKTFGDGIWAAPVISGDTIYVATMGGDLYSLKLSDGSENWEQPFHSSGAFGDLAQLNDQTLFVPSLNKHVYLLNPADGSVEHDFVASDWVWTQPAFDTKRNQVYFGDFAGDYYALDITSGAESWHVHLGADRVKSAGAIVDNVLVVGDRKPTVHFLDLDQSGKELNAVPVPSVGTIRADATAHGAFVYLATTGGKLLKADPGPKSVIEVTMGGRQ